MKSKIIEIKNALDEINSRLEKAEERIRDREDIVMESNQAEQVREKNNQNENRLRELSESIKHNDIHIIGIPEEEEREKGVENLFEEKIAENVLNLGKNTEIQTKETQRSAKKSTQ